MPRLDGQHTGYWGAEMKVIDLMMFLELGSISIVLLALAFFIVMVALGRVE